MKSYLTCEFAEQNFGQTQEPIAYDGNVTIKWLKEAEGIKLQTGVREYQREKVASLFWKQCVMKTIISKGHAKIPQIHIRVVSYENGVYLYEIIDGQQRVTAVIDYLKGNYRLPYDMVIDGCDCSNLLASELLVKFPKLYARIVDYKLSCVWYENLDEEMTSDLFVNILNNVNDMKPQEIRNAVRGFLSSYIRDTARFEKLHKLFTRKMVTGNGGKQKQTLLYFSSKFSLAGRMEVDEWLSELIYMKFNGYQNGVKPVALTEWVKKVQAVGGDYSTIQKWKKVESKIDELVEFAFKVISNVDANHKEKLTSMLSMIMVLYADSLRDKNYTIRDMKQYTKKFFDVYREWSDVNKKKYLNHTMINGKDQLQPFDKLFSGKNAKAIKTIVKVLDMEFDADYQSFGLIKIDPRETFSEADIYRKWEEQGFKCYYTGYDLDENEIAGDHFIPRSWGIEKGGVTEYHNLVVTSETLNKKKNARHGDEFMREIKSNLQTA
jgi:hypothetical protein